MAELREEIDTDKVEADLKGRVLKMTRPRKTPKQKRKTTVKQQGL
jgi:HSP20 family molecular chaperone IbpA